MVSVLVSKAVDRGFIRFRDKYAKQYATDEPTIYHFGDKHANHDTTDEPTIYCFRDKNVNHYATNEPTIYQVSILFLKAVDRGFIGV
jgi:hypothetical protein